MSSIDVTGEVPTLLRNGTLVDGSGGPARPADVVIQGDRIVEVVESGSIGTQGSLNEVDLSGLTLTPGFIDIHTHYDAQILWDPDLSPSSWYGVTSVIAGNCGFGVAPTRPDDRETILRTLVNVEGMSFEALQAGMVWDFETFPEYMDALRICPKRINIGVFLGHTPLRRYVLGEDATEREATDSEVELMVRLAQEALEAGAIGFSTSLSSSHRGAYGKPVPSRLAKRHEIRSLVEVFADSKRGVVQANQGQDFTYGDFSSLAGELDIPITWTAALTGLFGPTGGLAHAIEKSKGLSANAWPQIACHPLMQQITLLEPVTFTKLDSFRPVFELPSNRRAELYGSKAWRDQARGEVEGVWSSSGTTLWERMSVQETEKFGELRGKSLAAAAEEAGCSPFDLMLDIALAEDLSTRFRLVLLNDDEEELTPLMGDERTLVGFSDAGAHASMICDAGFSTYLLSHWVRELGALSLERAIWRLTGQPAAFFGLKDRGLVQKGYVADLVAFDPKQLGLLEPERRWDLPGGADRVIVQGTGIQHVWVSGSQIVRNTELVDESRPGKLLEPSSR